MQRGSINNETLEGYSNNRGVSFCKPRSEVFPRYKPQPASRAIKHPNKTSKYTFYQLIHEKLKSSEKSALL